MTARYLPTPDLCLLGALLLIGSAFFLAYQLGAYRSELREENRLRLALKACRQCRGRMCAACDWTGLAPEHRRPA